VVVVASALMLGTVNVGADVLERSESHFVVRNAVTIAAPTARVFRALTAEVSQWWDPAHTFFGSADGLIFEPRVGGCFCERMQDGRGVEHMRVVYAEPGRMLRLTGALGPLQPMTVTGVATWTLADDASGTTLEMTYSVAGYMTGGVGTVADAVDGVLAAQLRRLKAYVELRGR